MNLQTWYRYFVVLTVGVEMFIYWAFHIEPTNPHKAMIEERVAWAFVLIIPVWLLLIGLCQDLTKYFDREYKKKTGEDKPHFIQTYDGGEVIYFKNTIKVYNNGRPVLVLSDDEFIYLSDLVRKISGNSIGKSFLTNDEKTALQQTLTYCKQEEGKSQLGYFSYGWAGNTLQNLLNRS